MSGLATTPLRDAATERAWQRLHETASARYRPAGRFAWQFARGKLARDPVFRGLVEHGHLAGRRVVDIGCGQGLMASLLESSAELQRAGAWPAGWPAAPQAAAYTGIELMARDVERARHALRGLALAPSFVCDDMRRSVLPDCDLVVILDVLHYIDLAAQEGVLERVRAALAPHGRLLLRVGDRAQRRRYAVSQWVDRIVTGVRGHRIAPTWGRSLAEWSALLGRLGFRTQALPMSRGTPFANVLLVAELGAGRA